LIVRDPFFLGLVVGVVVVFRFRDLFFGIDFFRGGEYVDLSPWVRVFIRGGPRPLEWRVRLGVVEPDGIIVLVTVSSVGGHRDLGSSVVGLDVVVPLFGYALPLPFLLAAFSGVVAWFATIIAVALGFLAVLLDDVEVHRSRVVPCGGRSSSSFALVGAVSPRGSASHAVPAFEASLVQTVVDLNGKGDVFSELVGSLHLAHFVLDVLAQSFVELDDEGLLSPVEASSHALEVHCVRGSRPGLLHPQEFPFGRTGFVRVSKGFLELGGPFGVAAEDSFGGVAALFFLMFEVVAEGRFPPFGGFPREEPSGIQDSFMVVLEPGLTHEEVGLDLGKERLNVTVFPVIGEGARELEVLPGSSSIRVAKLLLEALNNFQHLFLRVGTNVLGTVMGHGVNCSLGTG
jgi:hypothetical protein